MRATEMLARALVLLMVVLGASVMSAGQEGPGPAFDVASVKPFQPVQGRRQPDFIELLPGGRVVAPSATLRNLITRLTASSICSSLTRAASCPTTGSKFKAKRAPTPPSPTPAQCFAHC
jgi:hypothetical protein